MKGTLYIVSTPIGNLEDMTLRALRILKEVDVIAAEDTRHSSKLLNHYGISKPLVSYWSEKEKVRSEEILRKLDDGLSVALVTDAGTPGISDPGSVLIGRAIEEGVEIVPVPGPSALITALSIAGLPTKEFTFIGFLPPKRNERIKRLRELEAEPRTLIFYEAPHRVLETLNDMFDTFGERAAVLIKELTKMHEEVLRGTIDRVIALLSERVIAGEYVILVDGKKRESVSFDEALAEVRALMKKGRGRKDAARMIADQYGLSKNDLYERSLEE